MAEAADVVCRSLRWRRWKHNDFRLRAQILAFLQIELFEIGLRASYLIVAQGFSLAVRVVGISDILDI